MIVSCLYLNVFVRDALSNPVKIAGLSIVLHQVKRSFLKTGNMIYRPGANPAGLLGEGIE